MVSTCTKTIAAKLLRGVIAGMWSVMFEWYLHIIVDRARRAESVVGGALEGLSAVERLME